MHAADEISGDLCEVWRLDDTHVAVLVADATGHGPAAAQLATIARDAVHAASYSLSRQKPRRPDDVCHAVNRTLLELDHHDCHFVTAVYAVYDERRRILHLSRAGAPCPVLIRNGGLAQCIRSDGPLLGAIEEACFTTVRIDLKPEDAVLIHTDGLESLAWPALAHETGITPDADDSSPSVAHIPLEQFLSGVTRALAATPLSDPKLDDVSILTFRLQPANQNLPLAIPVRANQLRAVG